MSNRIGRITIVGGGTAGWLTALILNSHLNRSLQKTVKITLIESPKISTIGVGESTIQNLKFTLRNAGIDEAEFLRRSNGSFKLGVHFIDWSKTNTRTGTKFFHPLDSAPPCGGLPPAFHFRKYGPHWLGTSYGENVTPNAAVIAAGKGPRPLNGGNYSYEVNYAYHLDAVLFADYLRDFATGRGVEHIRDDVLDVINDESGAVSALQLEQRGSYPIEFVVDCTGFRSLIWNRMGVGRFISTSDRLPNDRAIPIQIPHRDPTLIEPCTRATALGAGWAWRVPLYNRVGTGYVYSSAFRTDDEARAELIDHLRVVGDLPADEEMPETRVIKMRIGYTREPWIKNCVAIGLSSGFVEPLEATAIYAIDAAAQNLVLNFPDKQCSPALAKAYNAYSTTMWENIVDFLQTHYITSNRTEPYWEAVRQEPHLSDWLDEKLELWRHRFPCLLDTSDNKVFGYQSFLNCLVPKGYFDKIQTPLDPILQREDWRAFGRDLDARTKKLLDILPGHYQLVTKIRQSVARPGHSRSIGAIG